jgi:hypothetical protein
MSPVPLTLPVRAADAAALADLVLQVVGRGPVTDAARHQLAARLHSLALTSFTVLPWSLAADPGAPRTVYVAVDAKEPWLLHIAPEASPASGLFPQSTLIGRMRTPGGAEVVVNAIPFGPSHSEAIKAYAERLDRMIQPRPQGSEALLVAAVGAPDVAFAEFRQVSRKYGLNVAAFETGAGAELPWAAARHGWREGYSALGVTRREATDLAAAVALRRESRLVDINLNLGEGAPATAEEVRVILRRLRDDEVAVQAITVRVPGELGAAVRQMQETARQFGALLRVEGSPGHTEEWLGALGVATTGRLYYRMHPEQPIERLAEIAGCLRG